MRIIFFGNTKYSVIVAKTLHDQYELFSVVTIPNRPVGRKKILTPSPVKQFAIDNKITVLTFDKLDNSAIKQFSNKTIDFLVVADYGLILPKELLNLPKYAALNVHQSLLPKYRGPSPAPTAILRGDKVSGVTIIKMIDKVDAGDIIAQKEYELKVDETTDSLLTTLNTLGSALVVDVIKNYESIIPTAQDESQASLTKHMTRQDGFIDLTNPPDPQKLDRMIRAYYPWPAVWTRLTIQQFNNSTINNKVIKFLPRKKIQVSGGKSMSLKDFLNGYPETKGILEKLGIRG